LCLIIIRPYCLLTQGSLLTLLNYDKSLESIFVIQLIGVKSDILADETYTCRLSHFFFNKDAYMHQFQKILIFIKTAMKTELLSLDQVVILTFH
jgi:hypothetical protein